MPAIEVDLDTFDALHALARTHGTTEGAVVRNAVQEYLARHQPADELSDDVE